MEFNDLLQEPAVKEYLKDFKPNEWKSIIKKTLLYGIHSLKALQKVGLVSPKAAKVPALQIADLKSENSKKHIKPEHTPNRSNSHSSLCKKHESAQQKSLQRLTPRSKQSKYHNGKYPTKLIGREICTTRETRQLRLDPSKAKAVTHRKSSEKDESSSLSTFNPTEDMQKVFRIDFAGQVHDKSIPKILQPVEIKPKLRHHNYSSISAQVFCSSSEVSD